MFVGKSQVTDVNLFSFLTVDPRKFVYVSQLNEKMSKWMHDPFYTGYQGWLIVYKRLCFSYSVICMMCV